MCFKIKYIYKINYEFIFSYMNDNNLDIVEFCNKCDITLKEFSNLMKNDPSINSYVFVKLVETLNVQLLDLIQ